MFRTSGRTRFFLSFLGGVLIVSVASAQSRKAVQLRGNLLVGQGPSTINQSNMLAYSTGTEVLRQPTPTAGYTGALGSSIYQPQSMSYQARSVAPPPSGRLHTPVSSATTHKRLYTPPSPSISSAPRMAAPAPVSSAGGMSYAGSFTGSNPASRRTDDPQEMLQQLQAGREKILEDPGREITTLVPPVAGEYRNLMNAGETAFKAGQYAEALKQFQRARLQSPSVPGAMIGCMMAQFALPDAKYDQAAGSLDRAIKVFPELPLVNLPPRGYFSDPKDYEAALARLEAHVKANPTDAPAQFLLSYMLWRDGKYDPAEAAITVALEHSPNASLTEAMETFIRNVGKTTRGYKGKLADLAKVQSYPWAGVELALPDGFEVRRGDRAFDVVVAGRGDSDGRPEKLIGLYAFGVGVDMTTGQFTSGVLEQFRSNPAVKDLQELERGTGLIADCVVDARMLRYTYQGKASRSAAACFVRSVKLPGQPAGAEPVRIAYLLTAEVPDAKQADLLPIIVAVARSIRFNDPKRPIDLPLSPGAVVKDPEAGVAISPPKTWSAAATPEGVFMGQVDYILGGVTSPIAQAGSVLFETSMTDEQTVEKIVATEKGKGYSVKLLDQSPAQLGDMDGYQIVLQKQVTPQGVKDARLKDVKAAQPLARPGPPFIEIVRFSLQPAKDGKFRGYFIGMSCFAATDAQGRTVMDALAKTFQRIDIQPAVAEK